jgi:hypothetical protein
MSGLLAVLYSLQLSFEPLVSYPAHDVEVLNVDELAVLSELVRYE